MSAAPPTPTKRTLLSIRPEERATVLLSTLTFFSVLASYFVLKPLRDEIGISRGTENLPYLWTGTLAVTFLLAPLFAWLVSRFPRRTFLPVTYRFFALNLLCFAALSRVLTETPLVWMRFAFYFWVSAFNMFVVSVFWAAMADLFRLEQSRRLFGFIAVGGTLGAIVGGWFTKTMVGSLGSMGLMVCSVVLLELAAQCMRRLMQRIEPATSIDTPPSGSTSHVPRQRLGTAWSGMQRVLTSPYMRAIAVYILLQTLASGFLDLQLNQLIHDARTGTVDRTQAFANRDIWTQVATLALQLFVTGQLIPRLGVSGTLVIQPLITLAGFALLAWALPDDPAPGGGFTADMARLDFALWTAILFQAAFKASQNAFARPARETLFTVVDREEKYKTKSFLDTFVLRGGDVLFAWIFNGLRSGLAFPASLLAGAVIPFAGGWMVVSWLLGRAQAVRARGRVGA